MSEWVSHTALALTDVTLVSDYTYRRLYWCDPDYTNGPDDPHDYDDHDDRDDQSSKKKWKQSKKWK